MIKHKEHFKNLDGLRFFAALFVVINHTESIKNFYKLPSLHEYKFFRESGSLAVKFFFVLSGFLITYLLLQEKEAKESISKNISIGAFYKKRILRIWPLYYTLVLATFFVFPSIRILQYSGYKTDFFSVNKESFVLYLFFMPNLAARLFGNVMYFGQLWSLSVEEFFYLLFPLFIYVNRRKKILTSILVFLFVYFIVVFSLTEIISRTPLLQDSLPDVWLRLYQVYIFLFGSLAAIAYLHYMNHSLIIKYNYVLRWISYLLLIVSLSFMIFSYLLKESQFKTLLYPSLFTMLILALCISKTDVFILNNKVVSFLGKLSFGIYMLHPIAITICIKSAGSNSTGNIYADTLFFDIASLSLSVLIAAASYTFLEKQFLKLRLK